MKHNRLFRILVAAVVLSLLMIAIPATPALALTGVIDITSPATNTGPVGATVTLSCTGFTASLTYTVYFGTTAITTGSTSTGNFTATFTVPSRVRGGYSVTVTTASDTSNTETFTVTPEITLTTPSPCYVGDTVTVSGTGFAASAGITILYDGVSKGTTTAAATGTFTGFSLTVPDSVKGNHTVEARETSATSNYDTATFTVSPKITISPTSGAVGDIVTISGTGFAASSSITIYFDSVSQTTTSTNSSGTFTATTFAVPSTSRGSHTVKAQDASSNQSTATFSVSTKITINPPSGPSGTTVTVTGTGFGASQPVTIKYNNVTVVTTPSPITTTSAGYFTATFVVPVSPVGTYVVSASDGVNTATANFQSTTDATISTVTSASAPGNVGMSLTIEGVGFLPNHTITVSYDNDPTPLATVTSGTTGNFTAPITIPASVGGPHTITVTDGTTTKTFTFYMELNPPPIPALVLPLVDTKLKDGEFDWGEVTDPEPSNPVTYSLQVAIDADFTTPLVDKTGLTTSAYTLLDEEKLESTGKDEPYYWHVRAVDAASNASAWSEPSTFTVGFSFEFTGWVMWVIMGAIALVFFIFGVWVGKRSGGGYY
ncbi:MAG: IPT/TIG domain-containing protein [Chloroflexi bacterium]|nr:IPT/TIG domain-containing protein [Chloroflexota bacterium]